MSIIGLTKGSALESKIDEMWKGEAMAAAAYQAFAIVAEEKGLSELAEELRKISADEARHGGLYAAFNGNTNENLKLALTAMSNSEIEASEKIKELAKAAQGLGLEKAAKEIEAAAKDEYRHGEALKKAIEKYI